MEFVEKIANWAKSQGEKQEDRSSPWAWVVGLVVAAIAAVAIGYAGYKQRKKGKELAKLKHEKDVAEKLKEERKIIDATTSSATLGAKMRKDIEILDDKLSSLNEEIKAVEDEQETTNETINKLSNWRDVDKFLNSGSTE